MFHNKNANFVNGVTINIKDKETIKTFYENVLGFNLINESETAVQFEVGDSNQFITFIEIQNGREPLMSEAGLFHIGILLPTLTTLADLLVHLSDFEVPVNGGQQSVATCLFIEDPEGNA
ncbi:MAG: VOC family protein, partial [Staphylococcus sp.]|nr:VOC family protein [Staphylococcus sp.]